MSAIATLAAPAMLWAQVSLYNYSESVETYTEVTAEEASYSLGVATWWPPLHNLRAWANNEFFAPDGQVTNGGYLGPAIGPGYPIGFNFTYNGDVFDRIGVANGGWISFGKSSDGNRSVVIFTSDHPAGRPLSHSYWQPPPSTNRPDHDYQRDRIAGWGAANLYMRDHSQQDPPGTISTLRIATIGAAPNRVCVVQWKDYLNAYPPSSSRLNFQIRLYETTNVVEVRFGPMVWQDVGGTPQIGLGGRTSEDFNNRKTVYEQPAFLYDWNTTVAGTVNTDGCIASSEQPGHPNGSGIPPVVGRTFRWTPPACPPPAWPLTVGEITFRSGVATWEPTLAGEYEYFVSAQNSITGTEVASGTTTDPEAMIEGLSPMTTYYIFVRGICDGVPGIWSLGTPFLTEGGGVVTCNGTWTQEEYCKYAHGPVEWHYASADGSRLKIEFLGGTSSANLSESFKVWDGSGPSGTPGLVVSGALAGQSFVAESGHIFIQWVPYVNGSCEPSDPTYEPFKWRVGCKNCTDPLVQYSVGEVDCAAQQYYVNASVFMLGSSSTLVLENSLGLPPMTVNTTGTHAVGPFPAGDPVIDYGAEPGQCDVLHAERGAGE
ncbi:MAG: fibronectin type III domain-containing protein [Flavobacteriales bacterium]